LHAKGRLAIKNDVPDDELLSRIITTNLSVFEKLRFKKRSVVLSVVTKLMKRARISPLVAEEIAEMVYEDIELDLTCEEMVTKCRLIINLFEVL